MGSPWNWIPALISVNWSDGATVPRKKFVDIFSLLDAIHQRDRQTDRQTDTGRQQRPRFFIGDQLDGRMFFC